MAQDIQATESILNLNGAMENLDGDAELLQEVLEYNTEDVYATRELFKKFWNDLLGDRDFFENLCENIFKKPYYCLVIAYKNAKDSGMTTDNTLFWMKVYNPIKLAMKKFRVGNNSLWEDNKKYFNEDYQFQNLMRNDVDALREARKKRRVIKLIE